MSRKNFLASNFFITASEKEAKAFLLHLPTLISNTSFLKENAVVHKLQFVHEDERQQQYCIDVSLLPLNDQFVRVNLHVAYANGHAFGTDAAITAVLQKFEQLIKMGKEHTNQSIRQTQATAVKKQSAFVNLLLSFFLSKYHY